MKIKFDLTCACKAPNFTEIEEDVVENGKIYLTTCKECNKTITLGVNELDKDKKVVSYTVQIKSE